ncbi:MAG: hypothetical protein RL375_4418 [Pseudomonadota bacterium]|jgi:hypothetical protein
MRPQQVSTKAPGELSGNPGQLRPAEDDRHTLAIKPDCPLCAKPNSAQLDAGCHGCRARDLAQSPAAWRALHGVTDVEIRDAILATYGTDGYKAGREAVWGWIQRLGLANRRAPASANLDRSTA